MKIDKTYIINMEHRTDRKGKYTKTIRKSKYYRFYIF